MPTYDDPMDRPGNELDPDYAWTREQVAEWIGDSVGSADRKLREGRRSRTIHRYRDANQVRYDEREVKAHLRPRAAWRRTSKTEDGSVTDA